MDRIVVTRFSAMGDVAMVASVLTEFQERHPDTEIVLVSRPFFSPFFDQIPRLIFHPFDPEKSHSGFTGILRLYQELKKYRADQLADLHNNIRSGLLRTFFKLSGTAVAVIDKGRVEKRALTRKRNKILQPLKHTSERYADVFRCLGYGFTLSHRLKKRSAPMPAAIAPLLASQGKKVGVAPFAQHPYKVFPRQKMEAVLKSLAQAGIQLFLFGGGKTEQRITERWEKEIPGVQSLVGKYTLSEELGIIAQLDLMVSMDSSGMHMASLMGTRCISLWGATHPFAGFLGYGQRLEDCIQVEHPSRPSSIYGNKPCLCDGTEAIDLIESEAVASVIQEKLTTQ